ncbi:putative oxalocrotonate tautomerase [Lasiosphaeria miniovina]|uniref:Oxalocrotonate tautomerase n=1 Tax=Lasiosphaeria miniovina TaxID=1954250 RepID=A0AA40AKV2_9PEZI|nr:putative oxalocrotonate tautomerase [Lasiosphaeria miniovina]KAK0717713.1 putative oxalocrotonate tautomerase [Lasiosphaeria miniovina]
MPLWVIYHPEDSFPTPESKQALAADITKIYTSLGLPVFYVIVNFVTLPSTSIFVGGKNHDKPYIRIAIDHIAVHRAGHPEHQLRMVNNIDTVLKPHIADKGYGWEFHIDETPRALWKINGFIPPPFQSEAEKKWAELNEAVEWAELNEGVEWQE